MPIAQMLTLWHSMHQKSEVSRDIGFCKVKVPKWWFTQRKAAPCDSFMLQSPRFSLTLDVENNAHWALFSESKHSQGVNKMKLLKGKTV